MRGLHHVELWVPDFDRSIRSWGWLLSRLGYAVEDEWKLGRSFRMGDTYIVLEQSSVLLTDVPYDRCRSGLNHLAFHADSEKQVNGIVAEMSGHGWTLMYPDQHPYAGGHYAAYIEDADGFEAELVAPTATAENE